MVDSDHAEIRYSLRPMTSLWRYICIELPRVPGYPMGTRVINYPG